MYKLVKTGKKNITVRIVADSTDTVNRITTFELEYPRFIHSELMTHRLFSRNAMSSRAIPVKTMIQQVRNSPAEPVFWGMNQPGMQAQHSCTNLVNIQGTDYTNEEAWKECANIIADLANSFDSANYHKQITNRLLEPFQMMKTIVTGTEFANFFWLRCDPDAQPEIRELAELMMAAYIENTPKVLRPGDWHAPYVETEHDNGEILYFVEEPGEATTIKKYIQKDEAIAISSSCCAQVSYRKLDATYNKAMDIYDKLLSGRKVHASPFEHQATPMNNPEQNIYEGKVHIQDGVTHIDTNCDAWSGNLKGWIQHRQLLKNHTLWDFSELDSSIPSYSKGEL